MLPDRVSNPGPLTYESGALPIALRGPALIFVSSPIYLYKEWPLFLFLYFRRSYLGTLPFSDTIISSAEV